MENALTPTADDSPELQPVDLASVEEELARLGRRFPVRI